MPAVAEAPLAAAEPAFVPPAPEPDLTRLLGEWTAGDASALRRLMPLIYDDLRRLAQNAFAGESPGHTLQATAVVHELYLRLLDQNRIQWHNRGQFFAVASTMIRRILVSHARRHRAAKRGGGAAMLSLDEVLGLPAGQCPDLVALGEALERLAEFAPRQSRIVDLRFFGGLTIEETAASLAVSTATIKLDWSLARAWLFRELGKP